MEFDFSEFFTKYEAIAAEADAAFNRVKQDHPDAVTCGQGCSDCCYALFDLTLIEALYLKDKFSEKLDPPTRSAVMERADEAERENYKLKRKVFKASQEGKAAMEILAEVAKMRIRCPLLDNEDNCELYEHRPITCRLYGIPMAMSGESHICGETAFEPGKQYPTANMDGFQEKLLALSQELVASLNTRHVRLVEVLVPVAMALMNDYDREYFGLVDGGKATPGQEFIEARQRMAEQAPVTDQDQGATWTLGTDGSVTREASPCASCASSGSCDQEGDGDCDGPS